jgi:type IV secretion system protein TrbJ
MQVKRMKLRCVLLALMCVGMLPVHAQLVVVDPTNLTQNILTATRTLQQVNNQIRQLQNEAQMLANESRQLTRLDFSLLNELRSTLASTNQLIQQARGLAFEVSRMESEFARLYPRNYGSGISGERMVQDARDRWSAALEGLRTEMSLQARAAQNFAIDERMLTDVINRSQSAVGQLQAAQATNQLLALQSRQAIQAQQLQITHDRAAALEQARQIAAQERAREVRRRFLGDGSRYTPLTVNFYGNSEGAGR